MNGTGQPVVYDQPRSDAIHFDVDGYKTIGARFAEAARELIYGQAIDARVELVEVHLADLKHASLLSHAAFRFVALILAHA